MKKVSSKSPSRWIMELWENISWSSICLDSFYYYMHVCILSLCFSALEHIDMCIARSKSAVHIRKPVLHLLCYRPHSSWWLRGVWWQQPWDTLQRTCARAPWRHADVSSPQQPQVQSRCWRRELRAQRSAHHWCLNPKSAMEKTKQSDIRAHCMVTMVNLCDCYVAVFCFFLHLTLLANVHIAHYFHFSFHNHYYILVLFIWSYVWCILVCYKSYY